jgi:hypothetical protein
MALPTAPIAPAAEREGVPVKRDWAKAGALLQRKKNKRETKTTMRI